MKSFISTLSWAVLAGLAIAKPSFTNTNYNIEAGKPFTLTWIDAVTVTINLKDGPRSDLKTIQTLATSASGGSFTWTPTGLPGGTYALEIIDPLDPSNPNYSSQFTLTGPAATSTTSSTAVVTSTTMTTTATTVSTITSTGSSSATGSSSSKSATGSTTTTGSNTASTTSSSPSTTTTPPNSGAGSLAAPIIAPLLLIAGLAAF